MVSVYCSERNPSDKTAEANAALIVRAVNHHADLLNVARRHFDVPALTAEQFLNKWGFSIFEIMPRTRALLANLEGNG